MIGGNSILEVKKNLFIICSKFLSKIKLIDILVFDLLFITLKSIYPRIIVDIYNKFKTKLYYYQFHSRFHNTHQRNCKCNRLLGQYSFHRFDKGLWHIHQYLKKLLQLGGKVCYLSVINIQSRFSNICLGIYNKFEMMLHYYQFHSWFHHIPEGNCKRNRLFGQCNSHRFDKG